jgi:hypothetical protein
MTETQTPADPSAYRVEIDRNEHGEVDAVRVVDVARGTTLYDATDDTEIGRFMALGRDEDGSPPDDYLPTDRGFILAALRDLGIPIQGEEEDAPPPAAPAMLPMEAALVPTRPAPLPALLDALRGMIECGEAAGWDVCDQNVMTLNNARAVLAAAEGGAPVPPAPVTIGITLEGGLVQGVWSETPDALRNVRVVVVDYDTEGADEDEITREEAGADGAILGEWHVARADTTDDGPVLIRAFDKRDA